MERPAARIAPREERALAGILLMLGALAAFTGRDTCAKWLVTHGMQATQAAFVRFAVHLVIVLAIAATTGERVWKTDNRLEVSLRGVALLATTLLTFISVIYLPLTVSSAMMFSGPLWICLLSSLFLGEQVGPRRWIAMLIGFIGILVVARPWTGNPHWAILLSLGAALCSSVYAILTRHIAGHDSTNTQQFYVGLVATIGLSPFAFLSWTWPADPESWIAFALLGVFGWGGHQLLTIAHRYAPASTLAPFTYFQILYMTASSWLIFHQAPDGYVLLGAGIVAASGFYIWLREHALAARTGLSGPRSGLSGRFGQDRKTSG